MPMCPLKIEEWKSSRKMSIFETGMHSTGSESPVVVCIYVTYGIFLGY